MNAPIRWGIVGCGDVCEVKSGPGFYKAPDSKLVAVMRRDGAKAKDFARRHNVPKWYDDAAKLIHDSEIDSVYIATPPKQHEEFTAAIAKAGKPVFVEKPMGRNHIECLHMIEACKAAKVPLFVAFYRRAQPRFQQVKQLIDSGTLGKINAVSVHLSAKMLPLKPGEKPGWRFDADLNGAGPFMDLACHTLDLLDYFLGPISEVHGFADSQTQAAPVEDIVTSTFRFNSGVLGTGTWCFSTHNPEWKDETTIHGSKGCVTFSTFGKQAHVLDCPNGPAISDIPFPQHVHQPLIENIVQTLLGRAQPLSTGESGARTNWVMDEMLKGWRNK
jgi:predicted dehydrogenase